MASKLPKWVTYNYNRDPLLWRKKYRDLRKLRWQRDQNSLRKSRMKPREENVFHQFIYDIKLPDGKIKSAIYDVITGILKVDGQQVHKQKGLIASNWLALKLGAEILEVVEVT